MDNGGHTDDQGDLQGPIPGGNLRATLPWKVNEQINEPWNDQEGTCLSAEILFIPAFNGTFSLSVTCSSG